MAIFSPIVSHALLKYTSIYDTVNINLIFYTLELPALYLLDIRVPFISYKNVFKSVTAPFAVGFLFFLQSYQDS